MSDHPNPGTIIQTTDPAFRVVGEMAEDKPLTKGQERFVDAMTRSGLMSKGTADALKGYETKDSGKREEYNSGMVRDTEDGKPRFALLFPEGVPYQEQMLTRFAALMARGAEKYTSRNWEKAEGEEELERYKSSALRHLVQWATDETDEDHASAVMFNLLAGETVKYKLRTKSA